MPASPVGDAHLQRSLGDEPQDELHRLRRQVRELQDVVGAAQAECHELRAEVAQLGKLRDACSCRCRCGRRSISKELRSFGPPASGWLPAEAPPAPSEDLPVVLPSVAALHSTPYPDGHLDVLLQNEHAAAEAARACAELREARTAEAWNEVRLAVFQGSRSPEMSDEQGPRKALLEAWEEEEAVEEAPDEVGDLHRSYMDSCEIECRNLASDGSARPSSAQTAGSDSLSVRCLQIMNDGLLQQLNSARRANFQMRVDMLTGTEDGLAERLIRLPEGGPPDARPRSAAVATRAAASGPRGPALPRPFTAPVVRVPPPGQSAGVETSPDASAAAGVQAQPDCSEPPEAKVSLSARSTRPPTRSSEAPSRNTPSPTMPEVPLKAPSMLDCSRALAPRVPASQEANFFAANSAMVSYRYPYQKGSQRIIQEMRDRLRGERLVRDKQLQAIVSGPLLPEEPSPQLDLVRRSASRPRSARPRSAAAARGGPPLA
mmetsp:Transcript_67509/g.187161  ORF Transcript_67509/g.187161 Transcript_67509/m.187161 type:complete len:489 (-) Transcript_67509:159-1625(-)